MAEISKILNATAVILCGGKSQRMGFDKAYIKYQNQWLILQNADILQKIFEQVVLVSNVQDKLSDIEALENFPVLTDYLQEKGPLGGIYTALIESETPYIFVMACDMPFISAGLIHKMHRELNENQVVLCVHEDKPEPLFAFYHKSCIPVFKKQLDEDNLKIRYSFNQLKVKMLVLSKEEARGAFANINTPKQLAEWKAKGPEK